MGFFCFGKMQIKVGRKIPVLVSKVANRNGIPVQNNAATLLRSIVRSFHSSFSLRFHSVYSFTGISMAEKS